MNRGNRPNQPVNQPAAHGAGGPASNNGKKSKLDGNKITSLVLLVSAAILIILLIAYLVIGGGKVASKREAKFVNTDQMQAVFLNGGQVYFGNIQDLNSNYMRLSDIYYLRVNQQVQPEQQGNNQAAQNDISLVKLGCELHGPEDEMLINREQVVFWENLKADGQVAQAVQEYVRQNPNGQDCSQQQSTGTNNNSGGNNNGGNAAGTQPEGTEQQNDTP